MSENSYDVELLNKGLIKAFTYAFFFWIFFAPTMGLLVSIKFHNPEFLGDSSWLTFGRLRPIHVNGVIFGVFSTGLFALTFYMVPRLTEVRMFAERLGWFVLVLWNLSLVAGFIALAAGFNQGLEAGEFNVVVDIGVFICFALMTIMVIGTVMRRREKRIYVALWYLLAAFVWTALNYIFGNFILPYNFPGVNNAALHGLYIHYIVGLWITPAGLAVIYYFLPPGVKNPLYSHKLSLIGFWSLAFFYPFVGTHHYLFSPIPDWAESIAIVTSMMLIIPVWTVTVNFFGTVKGRWGVVIGREYDSYAAKFLLLGAVYYLLGCFQGSTEALREVQRPTHFTDFVIAHSHNTIFGTFVVWVMGAVYYVWPRVTGRNLYSKTLADWHYWLVLAGFSMMMTVLIFQGVMQGTMWLDNVDFVKTVDRMKPYWIIRSISGAIMDTGIYLFIYNLIKSASQGEPITIPAPKPAPEAVKPPAISPIERPGFVMLVAGIGFFALAVFVQGTLPFVEKAMRTTTVTNVVSGEEMQMRPYSELELKGRVVYIREGCWYCHSQFVRPFQSEELRWGPRSQPGEYAYDQPHLFGTRRIGPDLTRVGEKYADGWHYAHHWDPRMVAPLSVMPKFPWLFNEVKAKIVKNGTLTIEENPELKKVFNYENGKVINITPNNDGLAFAETTDGKPELLIPFQEDFEKEFKGNEITILAPTEEGRGLIAYIQSLGTGIGPWRLQFYNNLVAGTGSAVVIPTSKQLKDELLIEGKEIYTKRCIGCHGVKGDGRGPVATFLNPRPRNFRDGVFKFRTTLSGYLPIDSDLYRTVTMGVQGTAMPTWHELQEKERISVIQYIKTFSERWGEEKPGVPIVIPDPPDDLGSPESIARGKLIYLEKAKCFQCHGEGGKGDGPSADELTDDWGFSIKPYDFTGTKPLKGGSTPQAIYRTFTTGLDGTPMPSFADSLTEEGRWQLVSFILYLRGDVKVDKKLIDELSQELKKEVPPQEEQKEENMMEEEKNE